MSWELRLTRRFARTYKKLTNATLIADTDAAVTTVAQDPDVGERQKGDLAQLWVHKFRSNGQRTCWATREKTRCSWFIWKHWGRTRIFRDVKR